MHDYKLNSTYKYTNVTLEMTRNAIEDCCKKHDDHHSPSHNCSAKAANFIQSVKHVLGFKLRTQFFALKFKIDIHETTWSNINKCTKK